MNRFARIVTEILLPPFIVAASTILYLACCDFARLAVTNIPLLAAALFIVSCIPSTGYALVMESAFAFGLNPRKRGAMQLSALVGAILGFGFLVVVGDSEVWTRSVGDYLFSFALGLACGLLVTLLIWRIDSHNSARSNA